MMGAGGKGEAVTPRIHRARIRPAGPDDLDAVRRIARAAYAPYVPRIGREPAPMVADFTASIVALPWSIWPIVLPSIPARRSHHQILGSNI